MNCIFKLLTCLAVLAAGAAQAGTVRLQPVSQTVTLGDQVVINAVIDGLQGPRAVGAYDFDVTFDPALLAFANISFGTGLDVLGLGSFSTFNDSTAGLVNVFELSLDTEDDLSELQASSFTLFTLTFDTLAAGSGDLRIRLNSIADAAGAALALNGLQDASVDVQAAPVPLPAAAWMLVSGAGMLFGASRRRRTGTAESARP